MVGMERSLSDTIDGKIGAVIAAKLAVRRVSRQELADYIPLDKASLSRSIAGTRRWNLYELWRVAEFLDTTVSDLVDDSETGIAATLGIRLSSWNLQCAAA